MDRRTFIKHCQLLGLPLLPSAVSTGLFSNSAAASTDIKPSDIPEPAGKNIDRVPFRVSIIGAGGLGTRLVSQISKSQFRNDAAEVTIRYFAVDTDRRPLETLDPNLVRPVWIPANSGVGGPSIRPSTARRLASQHSNYLFGEPSSSNDDTVANGQLNLAGTAMTIIVAGFGRGTGTGLTQEIARKSKEAGAFTAVFVTEPLTFEVLNSSLDDELRLLARSADTVVTIAHDESQPDALMKEVFLRAESEIQRRVSNLVDSVTGVGLIGFDLEDLRYTFSEPGISGFGSGLGRVANVPDGDYAHDGYSCDAALDALAMLPDIGSAKSALVMFSINKSFKLGQFRDCMIPIRSRLRENATITAVASYDRNLPMDQFALDIWVPNYRRL